MSKCNCFAEYVAWRWTKEREFTWSATAEDGTDLTKRIVPIDNCLIRLRKKANIWCTTSSGWVKKCPEGCTQPGLLDIIWLKDNDGKESQAKWIPVEDTWQEEHKVDGKVLKVTLKASERIRLIRTDGRARCFPIKIAAAIGFINEDTYVFSTKREVFTPDELQKLGDAINADINVG